MRKMELAISSLTNYPTVSSLRFNQANQTPELIWSTLLRRGFFYFSLRCCAIADKVDELLVCQVISSYWFASLPMVAIQADEFMSSFGLEAGIRTFIRNQLNKLVKSANSRSSYLEASVLGANASVIILTKRECGNRWGCFFKVRMELSQFLRTWMKSIQCYSICCQGTRLTLIQR